MQPVAAHAATFSARFISSLWSAAVVLDLIACGPGAPAGDAMSDVDASDAPFLTATHNPLPQFTSGGGRVISNVRLVVITYADDPLRAQLEAFGNWIGGSQWLMTVGADYGVGAGSLLGVVERTDNAPAAITDTQIETMLANGVADGTIPSPADRDYQNVLYMVHFPSQTTVMRLNLSPPQTSCHEFNAFHFELRQSGLHLAYAVIPSCFTSLLGRTVTASHEYIEAATDPYPLSSPAYQLSTTGWVGSEVADPCDISGCLAQGEAFVAQSVWSNSAAAMDRDPCVPCDPTRPYFNVSVGPSDVQQASPGETVTFTLTGYSLASMPDWQLNVLHQGGTLTMPTALDTASLNNGRSATFTVRVPATATSGFESYLIMSSSTNPRNVHAWQLAVVIM